MEIFADCDSQEIAKLRTCLMKFKKALEKKQELNTPVGKEFQKYLTIAHLVNLSNIYQKKGMIPLYAQISQSLLRYSDLVRVDKLFYNAGVACKKANNLTMSFLLLNRYLDIFEVIEDNENNGNLSEQGEFVYTDIPNLFDVPLPEVNLIQEQDKQNLSNFFNFRRLASPDFYWLEGQQKYSFENLRGLRGQGLGPLCEMSWM